MKEYYVWELLPQERVLVCKTKLVCQEVEICTCDVQSTHRHLYTTSALSPHTLPTPNPTSAPTTTHTHSHNTRDVSWITGSHHSSYSTSCDWVTPWLRSTKPKCVYPDEVKHNHISLENSDIWRCLRASMAILDQQWTTLVLLRFAAMSHDITQPCALATFSFNAPRVCGLPHLHWGSF